jgi:hypothetical protein
MICLLIVTMFASSTKIPSNVVQHVFLHEINKCIYHFDILIAKATTSNSNIEKRATLKNYVLMIVKIIGVQYKRQKQQEQGEERTNPYKNYASSLQDFFRGRPKKKKEMVRTGGRTW